MPILQRITASIMMHLNSIALSFIYTQHVKVFFTCKFCFYNPMCFNRYANYFPHNSHIIDLLCCKYVCYLSRMAVDVGHNRPIVLQICDVSPLRKHPKTSPIGILLCFSYDSIYFAEVFGKSTGLENIRISQMHSWMRGAVPNRDYFYRKRGEMCKNTTYFLVKFCCVKYL